MRGRRPRRHRRRTVHALRRGDGETSESGVGRRVRGVRRGRQRGGGAALRGMRLGVSLRVPLAAARRRPGGGMVLPRVRARARRRRRRGADAPRPAIRRAGGDGASRGGGGGGGRRIDAREERTGASRQRTRDTTDAARRVVRLDPRRTIGDGVGADVALFGLRAGARGTRGWGETRGGGARGAQATRPRLGELSETRHPRRRARRHRRRGARRGGG